MKVLLNILVCLLVNISVFAQNKYYVLFEYDKAAVPDTAMAFLIKTIYSNKVNKIYLEGHCDSIGSKGYNYDLSKRRVKAVEQLLIDNGFDRKKIQGKVGYGKDKPIAKNNSPQARQQNRRVLVRFSLDNNLLITKKEEITTEQKKHTAVVIKKEIRKRKIIKPQKPAKPPKELKEENFTLNSTIALPNLLFQGGRHYVINRSAPSLDTLIRILQSNPKIKIEIQGHVCCTTYHDDGYDWDTRTDNLSVNRAQAIMGYLIKKGISSTRLRAKGFGGHRKLFPEEENEYQRQQNRRVEVMVLSH